MNDLDCSVWLRGFHPDEKAVRVCKSWVRVMELRLLVLLYYKAKIYEGGRGPFLAGCVMIS